MSFRSNRLILFIALQLLFAGGSLISQNVISVQPLQNAVNVPRSASVIVTFSAVMDTSSITSNTVVIRSPLSEHHAGTFSFTPDRRSFTFSPASPWPAGERISVMVTRGVRSAAGDSLTASYFFEFTVIVTQGTGELFVRETFQYVRDGIGAMDRIIHTDLDGDGDVDLIAADALSNKVSVLKNDGSGQFTNAPAIDPTSNIPNSLHLCNINNDRHPDLLIICASQPQMMVMINNGDGTFSKGTEGTLVSTFRDLTTADLNGDGYTDIISPNGFTHIITILFSDRNGWFTQTQSFTAGTQPQAATTMDADNDGDIDVIIGDAIGQLFLLKNNGAGVLSLGPLTPSYIYNTTLLPANVNNDHAMDLLASGYNEEIFGVGINSGPASFTFTSAPASNTRLQQIAAGDVDADGDADVIAPSSLRSYLYRNNGTAVFIAEDIARAGESVTIADLNNDGDVDAAFADNYADDVAVLWNNNPPVIRQHLPDLTTEEDHGTTVLASSTKDIFTDPDRDTLIYTFSFPAAGIQLLVRNDSLLFSTVKDVNGSFSAVISVSDGRRQIRDTILITVTPVNDTPEPPVLISPAAAAQINMRDSIRFTWRRSKNADNDTVRYALHLFGPSLDTLRALSLDTTVRFSGHRLRENTLYHWCVTADDGTLSATSDTLSFTTYIPAPTSFALYQNYPNPFTAGTVIRYDLPERTRVSIVVYSILGQRIATVVNDVLPAKEHSAVWNGRTDDGSTAASGIYLYRMIIGGNVFDTKKCIILR